jgi:hypothetical protein
MPFAVDLQARISNRLFQTKFTPPRTIPFSDDVGADCEGQQGKKSGGDPGKQPLAWWSD